MRVGPRLGANFVEPRVTGKRLVSLVHHHQPPQGGRLGNQAADDRLVPQIGRGVVRIGDVGDGRAVLAHRRQHGCFVEFEIDSQWHAVESKPLQLRAHGVHDEPGHRRHDAGTRQVAAHGQQRNELIRPIAQHQRMTCGQVDAAGQRLLEFVNSGARIAIDGHGAQANAELGLQRRRQHERVLHGVEFDHARAVLDGIGVHGLHVLANHGQRVGYLHRGHAPPRIGGTVVRRSSAARACACKPSPYAISAAITPRLCAPAWLTSIRLLRF